MGILSVCCPKSEDHVSFNKTEDKFVQRDQIMFMYDDDSIYLHCKKHGFMSFKFYDKNGKKISFRDTSVVVQPINGYLKNEPAMVKALGEFNRKAKKCRT